jgi:(E)-4-hydroxy-3-methylbut-2-enyl-diphosphate synthase
MKYCPSVNETVRWKTREVMVGKVGVGGDNPVRIQSMTTSSTRDIEGTIEQIKKLADYGCEIARVTVQGKKEAAACEGIKNGLLKQGYDIPLVADIHFYPPAAMMVVEFVDKVRINPGNFIDRRATFRELEYTDESYAKEILRIEEVFGPFVEKCKKFKRSIRIGTNHGSLSDRIMNRYGDTPYGMVESAFEFTRVARKHDFHDIIYSMKASNPLVMMQAYRLLVAEMMEEGWNYPIHLGVTEAGDGEDGRVKSAIGIGSLLLDGIGDTIRVSLTEDPWYEIEPCGQLVEFAEKYIGRGCEEFVEKRRNIAEIERREVSLPGYLHEKGSVILPVSESELMSDTLFADLGCSVAFGRPQKEVRTADAILLEEYPEDESLIMKVEQLQQIGVEILLRDTVMIVSGPDEQIYRDSPDFVLFDPEGSRLHEGRRFLEWVQEMEIESPVIHYFSYRDNVIEIAAEYGALLADGLGEGICLRAKLPLAKRRSLSFAILQGCRMRQSKTEYIACPGCGRTLFNIQEVTSEIRARTEHLAGVNIAIMGCIVNGPGEMADADFGYVGSKTGMVDLYVKKECVERGIDESIAVERLIELLKSHGVWKEAKVANSIVK